MAINTNCYAWVRVSELRLCLLRRCSVVEKQRRMGMPESMESTMWKAELGEDRCENLLHGIFRSQEPTPCIQEEPFAFQRCDMFTNSSRQCIGQRQDRLAC